MFLVVLKLGIRLFGIVVADSPIFKAIWAFQHAIPQQQLGELLLCSFNFDIKYENTIQPYHCLISAKFAWMYSIKYMWCLPSDICKVSHLITCCACILPNMSYKHVICDGYPCFRYTIYRIDIYGWNGLWKHVWMVINGNIKFNAIDAK